MASKINLPISVDAEFPIKLRSLFSPRRYKIAYGGRGGCKSWGFARALILLGTQKPLRVLCARELQKSIKDSVHRLLSDQINRLSLNHVYDVQQATIRNNNGTEFFFEGLRHNAAQIKSYEGIDIAWVEEAVTVSKASWDFLIPTIRKPGSEIWVSFNPELEEDETYQRFVVHPPTDSFVARLSWRDNPWLSDELRQEMWDLKRRDPEAYETVWEGHCRQSVDGAVFATELREAQTDGRLTKVDYDSDLPLFTIWDLGYSDATSIWFIQRAPYEFRVVDFYQANFEKPEHYAQVLSNKPYKYAGHYLPHDARKKTLDSGGVSLQEQFRGMLKGSVRIVPDVGIPAGLAAARTVFPACWFDAEKCKDGLQYLRRYRYEVNADTGRISKNPLHDENSHAADAFRYFGVVSKRLTASGSITMGAATATSAQPQGQAI